MAFLQDFEAMPSKYYVHKICTNVIYSSKKYSKNVDDDGNL
jgi:hypothetical protein